MTKHARGIFALLAALTGAGVGAYMPSIGILDGVWLGFLLAIIVIGLFTG